METKKQQIENLLQACNNIKNAIYWMEKAERKSQVAILYQMMSGASAEISALSKDIKDGMFK